MTRGKYEGVGITFELLDPEQIYDRDTGHSKISSPVSLTPDLTRSVFPSKCVNDDV